MTVTEIMPPTIRRVRAYYAPVNRVAQQATLFDPAQNGGFSLNAPPAPWIDLGWIDGFTRKTETAVTPVRTGAPAAVRMQVRPEVGATVQFSFASWGKLQLALAAGVQQMNLLHSATGAAAAGSGGAATPATPLVAGSTATTLLVGASATAFPVGSLVAVDVDNASGTTGFIGAGVSGAYLRAAVSDVDYVRRVTLNVGRVVR